ncbi:hypothetical protein QQ44_15065 [Mycolicibacterium setense]|uniref:DUF4139 domain-containing protein n=1 Tax=Mycolicibacterium setense TaxID=431269 RepID=A0ABR4YTK1_9MYCO|nr:hypothetical protein [Mycolicibacterium setense]KHO24358.1 hypothetical protein QQ44_15065 [Mycolicibacterium setense]
MSTPPRVDRLVMYKHGVASVSRTGAVDGDFELTFRRDDMKDVLKSLTVEITSGQASVGTVAFDSPTDPRTELADRNLLLEPGGALTGLIEALRGRVVEIRCGDRHHRGEVIGVDDSGENRRLLVLRTEAGAVSLVDLAEADQMDLIEDPSRADLAYLIDRSRAATAGQDCRVTVQTRGSAEQARVSYIVPAPMWRVSYRLVRDGDSLVLAAMGIVHNPIDEDLTDVALTLTTGQPISFEIDLYHGRTVRRAVVEEPERVTMAKAARFGVMPAPAAMMDADGAFADYEDSVSDVETAESGEYFEYRLTAPVSLKRGGAAMVPLAVSPVDGVRRELVWRDGPPAPDIVLEFSNTTGVVLEDGPAVIYERDGHGQDAYAGEAMVPFSARDAKVRLPFAKDLSVRCRSTSDTRTVTARVRLADDAVVEEQRVERRHTLRVENDHDDAVDVIFELRRFQGHRIAPLNGVADTEEDGSWHRIRVSVPGHQTVEAAVAETWPTYTEIAYRELSSRQLEQWLAGRSLDASTIDELSHVLQRWEHADRLDAERERVEADRGEHYAAQGRIAEQLTVLGTDGAEGDLRRRQVEQLEQLQDRINELDAQVRGLRADADADRTAASDELQRLIGAV